MAIKSKYDRVGDQGVITKEPLWNGMRLVDKAVLHHGLDATDEMDVPLRRHRDIIFLYARIMFTSH